MDTQLFEFALAHRNFAFEHGRIPNNERLEFLDGVALQIVVTEHIFRSLPDLAEGQLVKLHVSMVSSHALTEAVRGLDLRELIRLGQGEVNTGGAGKISILADAMEVVTGAIHMSCDADAAVCFVHALLDERIASSELKEYYTDYRMALQKYCAHSGLKPPRCETAGGGPDHRHIFTATIMAGGKAVGSGVASSKKRAEQLAAYKACRSLLPDA